MKKFHVTNKIITASIVGTLTVTTTAVAAYTYQRAGQYKPSSSKESLKNNQVLFNDDTDSLGKSNNSQDSKWLQKQKNQQKKDATQNSNYLFDKNQNTAVQKTMTLNTVDSSMNQDGTGADTVLDVDKNAKDADTVIDGEKNKGTISDSNHNGGQGSGNNTNKTPSKTIDYSKIKDPTSTNVQNNKMYANSLNMEVKDYSSDKIKETKTDENYKMHILIQPASSSENMLYQGSTVTKKSLYNMLVTGIMFTYGSGDTRDYDKDVFYGWDENALGNYIKINAISVDDGKTWIKDFPYQIGNDVTEIKLDISYRLSTEDKWTSFQPDNPYLSTLSVSQTKVIVLKNSIASDSHQLQMEDIVNSSSQYLEAGSTLNLLQYQYGVLGDDTQLNALFPGWSENGKVVDWIYTVQQGRHFLEPMDLVPLDAKYTAKLLTSFETVYGKNQLCSLQTLTAVDDAKILKVPKYIQSLNLEQEQTFDSIELADTVMVVHDENITVKKKWIVSDDNENLAVKDGMLMSKDLSRIISVPESVSTIKITQDIKSLDVGKLEGKTIEVSTSNLPEIPYENLKDCKIILKDSLFDSYLNDNYSSIIKGKNITFAKQSDQDTTYTVSNHCIKKGKTLYRAIDGVSVLHVDEDIKSISKNAFKNIDGIQSLILSNSDIKLEKGCFDKSHIQHIYCATQEQKDVIEKQLKKIGYTDIQVHLMIVESNGFTYEMSEDGTITLLKASFDVVNFDGYVGNVLVDKIGDGAFKDCSSLKFVYLPENIKSIGSEAFENCTNLEIMLIDSKDTIEIGNDAFEGLSSIRMLASNASQAQMNGYVPDVHNEGYENVFFVPSFNSGYENAMYFISGYGAYTLEDIGPSTKAIYLNTWDGTPFLMMASEACVDSQVTLPSTTSEFYPYAMADTYSANGNFTLNLEDLNAVWYNNYAFFNSNISGDVTIGSGCHIDGYAFDSCVNINSVQVLDGTDICSFAFYNCANIQKATLVNVNTLESSAFYCNTYLGDFSALSQVEFVNSVPTLSLGTDFTFKFTDSSESDRIHIILTNIGISKEDFLYEYRYLFAGYQDTDTASASLNMWNDVKENLIWENWMIENYQPTYDEIYNAFKTKLLETENNLRSMLGLELVEQPTNMPDDLPKKEDEENKGEESKDENGDKDRENSTDQVEENEVPDVQPDESSDMDSSDDSKNETVADQEDKKIDIQEEDFQ